MFDGIAAVGGFSGWGSIASLYFVLLFICGNKLGPHLFFTFLIIPCRSIYSSECVSSHRCWQPFQSWHFDWRTKVKSRPKTRNPRTKWGTGGDTDWHWRSQLQNVCYQCNRREVKLWLRGRILSAKGNKFTPEDGGIPSEPIFLLAKKQVEKSLPHDLQQSSLW